MFKILIRRGAIGLAATLAATTMLAPPAVLAEPAAPTAPPPTARQLELAHRYTLAIHMDRMMDGMMKNMMPAMMAQMTKDSNLTDAQRQAIAEASAEAAQEMLDRLMKDMEPVMAETFTEKELSDLVTFYEGPTGRAVIEKTPQMMAKLMPVMIAHMPQMQAEIRAKLCAKIDCKALAKPPAANPS